MKKEFIIDNEFAVGGFTAGNNGIWTRGKADDPASEDYLALSSELDIPTEKMVRPYQANGEKVAFAGIEHGGCGVIKEDPFVKTDGLVTDRKGIMLSVIAADCVPIYLTEPQAGVIGLLHCGRQAAAGNIVHNAVKNMKSLGAMTERLNVVIGHHICGNCYEVGEEVFREFAGSFSDEELKRIFNIKEQRYYLDLARAIVIKAEQEGIRRENITVTGNCTCCDSLYFSYRRGDRGKQNLAFLMMR